MTKLSIVKRLEALERSHVSISDAEILAWGRAVTDEELERLVVMGGGPDSGYTGRMSEAEFYRMAKPFIEDMRRG